MHGLTKNAKAMGDTVIIEILSQDPDRFIKDGIWLPETVIENFKLLKGKVLDVGSGVKDVIDVGSTVLFDKWSVYGKNSQASEKEGEIVITKSENIIAQVENE